MECTGLPTQNEISDTIEQNLSGFFLRFLGPFPAPVNLDCSLSNKNNP